MLVSRYLKFKAPLSNKRLLPSPQFYGQVMRQQNFQHAVLDLYIVSDYLVNTLRATCCNGHLYLRKIEKNRFSETLPGRRFLLACFKTVTLRLFGFLFSSPDGLLYFDPKRAKLGPKITLFAKASKTNCYT